MRPDVRVARRAAGTWGVLSLDELRACGLSRDAVAVRVRKGWLHPMHRAVYAVGHANPSLEGRLSAAVKACGPGAVLSHSRPAWHDDKLAREDDAERQAVLEAHGERVLRVTWRQAIARPNETLSRIRAAGAPLATPASDLSA